MLAGTALPLLTLTILAQVQQHSGGKELPQSKYIRVESKAHFPVVRDGIKSKDGLYFAAASAQVRVNPKDGQRYVYIPPGKFQLGCSVEDAECFDDEQPPQAVEITKGFWLAQTEVTQAAYRKVTGKSPSYFKGDDRPVEQVSWDDAAGYCTLVGLRLPTGKEWEYAARAGTKGARYGALDQVAWYADNSSGGTKPVASKQPNAWGLYNMLGNVWEWTADYWTPDYRPGTQEDRSGRVLRGGSWVSDAWEVRASVRNWSVPTLRYDDYGFRCGGELR